MASARASSRATASHAAAASNSICPWRKTVSAQPLRLLLADDEPLALRRIKLALQAIPDVEIVGAASDGAQAITQMRDLRPDVVLLDIRMPLADGFEVANAVEDSGGPEVIFVSAFDSYALQAFETSAVDYLLKPVEFERLASALGRARERRAAKDAGRRAEELAAVLDALKRESEEREGPRYDKEFWIRDRGRFLRVPVSDVERIEAERDYVRLYWDGRTLLHRETMSNLEEKLDPNLMLRVHRSAFVNWKRLKAVRRDANGRLMAVLESGDEVPVSRAYAQRVMQEMKSRG
ncbi:MAG: response regulator transcription factor [Hyphomonadaceae bacterium]|nr:response regulator transcription factor [Hyphomonadaceae bacterium]